MSVQKIWFFIIFAVIASAKARGITSVSSNINNEIIPLEKESRLLLETPSVGVIILKSLKAAWFLLSTLCSVVDYKLAAAALAVNVALFLFKHSYPLIVGAVVVFGFCKLTDKCGFGYIAEKFDNLSYAAEYVGIGALKYGDHY
ncbi:uncharacterized protein LOC114362719 [Ostrinia furnacalis]|uniref:uncharacterized protein LOC114362719 n=1 Tax=Ostrinia furnacalis TaxID=93504 RepID=UPI00103B3222|nr:uncharacterized protein LOC114362719 [Ostrinia furnacalis]